MEAVQTAPADVAAASSSIEKEQAADYLRSLLNKNLLIHTPDGRMFQGEFMCTDPDRNVVLAHAYEYRPPTAKQVAEHAEQVAAANTGASTMTLNMTSRYLGMIVVPGKHIVKMELQQFASQMKH